MGLRFLLLEDNLADAAVIETMLFEGGIDCQLLQVATRAEFVTALETELFDLILSDYSLPQFDGISALEIAYKLRPELPFIFVSASLGEELAIETLKRGATDYVLKQRLGRLVPCVQRALREAEERRERQRAEAALRQSETLLRTVAANLPNGAIFIVDRQLRYQLAEGKALEQVGLTSDDLVGKTLWEALDPILADQYAPYYRQALQGQSFSLEHYSHDRHYVSHSAPLYNEQGDIDAVLVVSHDITDRKQAELALRESEERFRTLADNMSQFAWMGDPNGWLFWYNRRWLEYTGTTLEQMQGWGWQQVHHPDHVDRVVQHFQQCLSTGEAWEDTFPLRGKDGNYRWFLSRAIPIRNAAGEILRWFGTNTDITDLKLSEEALRRSEERLRSFVEGDVVGILFGDIYGAIHEANDELLRIIGYSRAELQAGQIRWVEITPPEYLPIDQQHILEAQAAGGCPPYEKEYIRKDGSRVPVLVGFSLLGEAREETVAFILDLSERKQANDRLHLLYETTRDLLATHQPMQLMHNLFGKLAQQLDLDGYYNYMVAVHQNHQMLHLKNHGGISEQDARAVEWIEFDQYLCGLVAKERRQLILNATEIAQHPKAELIRARGITAYAGQPLIVQGRLLGTLSFTSCRRSQFTPAEADLLQSTCEQIAIAIERANLTASIQQQAEQLRQANQIKDEFLAVLSHELRSPLNPILGWARLLQTRKFDETKTAQALSVIERNAKLLSELIEDLLDVSRILRGKLQLTVSSVNLASIIQAALDTVRLAAEAKSIQIQVSLNPNVGPVSGDPNRLQQVIWNLLSNAIKFTEAGGAIQIRLETVGNHAQIQVSDTGKGIHPDFLPYVFDCFRQEDSGTTRQFGGLGLGLAIVRHLVELHGGRVESDSAGEGQGATFTVRLPLMAHPIAPTPFNLPAEPLPSLRGMQILVVDDDADTRAFLTFLLEQYEAHVTPVTAVGAALRTLGQSRFDLLVSDIGMPDMDGYMFLQQLRKLPAEQGGTIPAIALTAYASEMDYQQAIQAGFQRHVAKPVDPIQLVTAITSLVRAPDAEVAP